MERRCSETDRRSASMWRRVQSQPRLNRAPAQERSWYGMGLMHRLQLLRAGSQGKRACEGSSSEEGPRVASARRRIMARGRDKIAQLPRECCELGDAVGADPVDAELPQCFPFVWIVGGPRDDSRTRGVRSSDQVLVDERN